MSCGSVGVLSSSSAGFSFTSNSDASCVASVSPGWRRLQISVRYCQRPLTPSGRRCRDARLTAVPKLLAAAAAVDEGTAEQFVENNSIADFMRFRKGNGDGDAEGVGELQTAVVSYRKRFPWSLLRPFLQVLIIPLCLCFLFDSFRLVIIGGWNCLSAGGLSVDNPHCR